MLKIHSLDNYVEILCWKYYVENTMLKLTMFYWLGYNYVENTVFANKLCWKYDVENAMLIILCWKYYVGITMLETRCSDYYVWNTTFNAHAVACEPFHPALCFRACTMFNINYVEITMLNKTMFKLLYWIKLCFNYIVITMLKIHSYDQIKLCLNHYV